MIKKEKCYLAKQNTTLQYAIYKLQYTKIYKIGIFSLRTRVSKVVGTTVRFARRRTHGLQKMKPCDFGEPLTFNPVPPAGQNVQETV